MKNSILKYKKKREKVRIGAYKLFWIFFIGCIVGVAWESFILLIKNIPLESRRGLIYGPFNPVYGFGAVILTEALKKSNSKQRWKPMLIGSFLGGGFEYFASFFQEHLFGTVSWDYSNIPLNINGRTNVAYALFWGLMGLVWVDFVYPLLSDFIERIHHLPYTRLITSLTALFMAFNMFISGAAVYRQSQRSDGIAPKTQFGVFLDENYDDELLEKVYPNMIEVKPIN